MELTTPRLRLTPVTKSDLGRLHRLFTNAEIRKYLLDGDVVSLDWVAAEIDASNRRFLEQGCGLWSICRLDDGRRIGFVGFRPFFESGELQLLYGLEPDAWGLGYATEAARAVIAHGFTMLRMDRIVCAADTPNRASIRVMERLGMRMHRTTPQGAAGGTVYYVMDREAFCAPA